MEIGPNRPPTAAPEVVHRPAAKAQKKQSPVISHRTVAAPVRHPATSVPAVEWPSIPPILLEGDQHTPETEASPLPGTERFALGTPPAPTPEPEKPAAGSDFPGAFRYGPPQLFIVACDPHCLHVSWDFTPDQGRAWRDAARDRRLVLRVFELPNADQAMLQLPLPEDQRQLFVAVDQAGARYRGEVGCYLPAGEWQTIAASLPVSTPEEPSIETEFNTEEPVPLDVPAMPCVPPTVLGPVAIPIPTQPPPRPSPSMECPESTQRAAPGEPENITKPDLPRSAGVLASTTSQTGAQPDIVAPPPVDQPAVRESRVCEESPFVRLADAPRPRQEPLSAPSSFAAAPEAPPSPREFWFNVNAELVIYGATEPDATVTLAGRTVVLRPDGTFSHRFALPDGHYELVAAATSADAAETRTAHLNFTRATDYRVEKKASAS